MRIGMLGPVTHPYPPDGYGPWEQVTHDLTEGLVGQGHDVVLFGPEGSITSADLYPTIERPLVEVPEARWREEEDRHIHQALVAAEELGVEVVHSHLHVHALSQARLFAGAIVSTLHGVAWNREIHEELRRHSAAPFVSLSDSERDFLPELNYVATVPNGIATDRVAVGPGDGGYVAFVGRISPEKAPHLAVEAARRSGFPLLMAGVVEEKHRAYAERVIEQLTPVGEFLGALARDAVYTLLGSARATLMPLAWDEPFGLVVVESLAAGTPVVAWRRGAMPEIIDDRVTGNLVDGVDGAVDALESIDDLDRSACAAAARERFDRAVMAASYAAVYEDLISSMRPGRRSS